MSPDLETLRAHADGELAPLRRAEVDAAIAADPSLAALSAALFASRLPYRSAFERVAPPPVPAALQARVAELASVARANATETLAPAGASAGASTGASAGSSAGASTGSRRLAPSPPESSRPTGRWAMLLLLSGVVLGCLLAAALASVQQRQVEPWLRSVITYHAMYSRETVTDGGPALGQAQAVALRKALHDQQGLELTVPDLRAQGLQFVRAQRLQFDGRTVLQLVYLPQRGAPVALCLMPAARQPERTLVLDGQQALAWHAGGWAYVLIGALPLQQLQTLRQRLPAALI